MSWFKKLLPSRVRADQVKKQGIPQGLWLKCQNCQAMLYRAELQRNLEVCPKCDFHHRIVARVRLDAFLDSDQKIEILPQMQPVDTLKFKDSKKYKDRITQAQKSTKEKEALIVIQGKLYEIPVVVCCFNFGFMGGSMGSVVGEKFTSAVNICLKERISLICFSASGGARMQEGLFSLMQMAKISAALGRLGQASLPYISVLTDPTMGGVSASLAMLGDIIIAEPKALIGFAGPRVIQQTVHQQLPGGFQRSEFLLEHGQVDMILNRLELRDRIANLLAKLTNRKLPKLDIS